MPACSQRLPVFNGNYDSRRLTCRSKINHLNFMKINLIQYINENTGNFLFLHSQLFGSYNIVSFIIVLPQMVGKSVFIITEDKDKINRCLPSSLPNDNYVKYKEVKDKNLSEGYILIDDLKLYQDNNLQNILIPSDKLKVIILTKGNIKIDKEFLNITNILYLCLCEDSAILKHDLSIISTDTSEDLENKNVVQNFWIKKVTNNVLLSINKKHLITGKKREFLILNNFTDIIYTDESMDNIDVTNIETIHTNRIKLDYYIRLINGFYKKNLLSDDIDVLTLIFYVDTENIESVENYNKIIIYIEEYEKNFKDLLSKALKIRYDDDIGAHIEKS